MNIVETALVFAGIPLAFVLLMAVLVYGRAELRQQNRYRPGRAWQHEPVWYLPHPDHVAAAGVAAGSGRALASSAARPALTTGDQPAPTPSAVGGASGEW